MTAVAAISQQIWDMKYRLKGPSGEPVDKTIEDTWRRVARALASVEAEPARWEPRFYRALEDFRFLPAGRILSGAGSGRRVRATSRGCSSPSTRRAATSGGYHGPRRP